MTVTRDGIHAMMKAAKAGMHEYQLEAVFNKVLADAGVREPAFANIVSAVAGTISTSITRSPWAFLRMGI